MAMNAYDESVRILFEYFLNIFLSAQTFSRSNEIHKQAYGVERKQSEENPLNTQFAQR